MNNVDYFFFFFVGYYEERILFEQIKSYMDYNILRKKMSESPIYCT